MRVTNPNNSPIQRPEVSGAKQTGKAGAAPEARKNERPADADVAEAVSASISPRSREFAQAKAVATSAPDVREDKIAELRKRIAEKSYHVNSDAIADRMVDDHL